MTVLLAAPFISVLRVEIRLSCFRRLLYAFRPHSKKVKIHEASIEGDGVALLAAGVKELLFLCGKQRLETILLIERYDMRFVYGINDDETAASLVVA